MRILSPAIVFLLISSYVIAGDFQVYDNYTREPGAYYKLRVNKLQKYDTFVPQYGEELRPQGNRLQQYDGYIKQPGDYYKWNRLRG